MNSSVFKFKNLKNLRISMIVLSAISLIFTYIGSVTYFAKYVFYNNQSESYVWIPGFTGWLCLFFEFSPLIVLFLYILNVFKTNKTQQTIFFIIHSAVCLRWLLHILYWNNCSIYGIIDNILYLILFGSFLVPLVCSYFNLKNKFLLYIPSAIGIFFQLYFGAETIYYFTNPYRTRVYIYGNHPFFMVAGIVGTILFLIVLLLLECQTGMLTFPLFKKFKNLNPQQALTLLKEEFDLGEITEEEYQARRTEILQKL